MFAMTTARERAEVALDAAQDELCGLSEDQYLCLYEHVISAILADRRERLDDAASVKRGYDAALALVRAEAESYRDFPFQKSRTLYGATAKIIADRLVANRPTDDTAYGNTVSRQ